MLPEPSLVSACFVARQIGYRMDKGWPQGESATIAWFSPLATYEERFDALLGEIAGLGYRTLDLWGAHLHWSWATLEHIAAARRVAGRRNMVFRTYAAWVGGGASELAAACRLCTALDIPIIAGHCELFATDRSAAVAILRGHGIRYAIENHPETSAAAVLARLGPGDEDVVGVALDTGWCATRGWDAAEGLRILWPRVMAVHLKDVKATRAGKTGFEFIDMGHETCRLGEGVVPIRKVVDALKKGGFRGPVSVEHEPEEFDPSADLAQGLKDLLRWWDEVEVARSFEPLRVVVVGCGHIAGAYGEAMSQRPEIKILGAADIDPARASAWAAKHGGRAYADLDAVLRDPAVEAVVNLTIQHAHVEVITRALEAGKHVHSEKPLATSHAEAAGLVRLAESRNLRLSCAPVTWLGEAQQTAWKLIRDGAIGTPRIVYATVDWARIETFHLNPVPFYAVGPLFDVGVYPLALMTAWFGPVARVVAGGGLVLKDRVMKDGRPFTPGSEDWIVALLEFRSGVRARLSANFYVGDPATDRAAIAVHGDLGSVATTWYAGSSAVNLGKFGEAYRRVPPVRTPMGFGDWWCDWSAGVVGLAKGIRTNTPHPTGAAQAAHVVEIIEASQLSMREGRAVPLTGDFPAPPPMDWAR
jgi:predicted dehydrogenase/sugar phosphate isomerase/epimerase